ncbi:MAG: phytanoyl-CoA dioxygenase family protein [Gammaproteobacteria bacterium]|nr:phytanoyl-CoA dioxygenase family protein [Gammaproteobacteria bacterium]
MHLENLQAKGFAVVQDFANPQTVSDLQYAVKPYVQSRSSAGVRNIAHKSPQIQSFADSTPVRNLVEDNLGENARLVRSIVFNKTTNANWLVTWHQDLSIAVNCKVELPGFNAWSTKAGVYHVQPPLNILEQMLTLRIHLDDTNADNGALMVVPGSHQLGRIPAKQVTKSIAQHPKYLCAVKSGDVLLLKPLLVHCSKKASVPGSRRIIHLEFCTAQLPAPLQWVTTA